MAKTRKKGLSEANKILKSLIKITSKIETLTDKHDALMLEAEDVCLDAQKLSGAVDVEDFEFATWQAIRTQTQDIEKLCAEAKFSLQAMEDTFLPALTELDNATAEVDDLAQKLGGSRSVYSERAAIAIHPNQLRLSMKLPKSLTKKK